MQERLNEVLIVSFNKKDMSIDFPSFTQTVGALIKEVNQLRKENEVLQEQMQLIDYWKDKYFSEINNRRGLK